MISIAPPDEKQSDVTNTSRSFVQGISTGDQQFFRERAQIRALVLRGTDDAAIPRPCPRSARSPRPAVPTTDLTQHENDVRVEAVRPDQRRAGNLGHTGRATGFGAASSRATAARSIPIAIQPPPLAVGTARNSTLSTGFSSPHRFNRCQAINRRTTVFSRQCRERSQHMVWDEETIRHLRDLWTQGLSTAEIGRRLNVSKNAIVGKAHRLDLDARPSPIRRDVVKQVIERPLAYPRTAGPTLPPLASAGVASAPPSNVQLLRSTPTNGPRPATVTPAAPPTPRALMPSAPSTTIQARRSAPSCCWPIGEPGTKTFRFCDDRSVAGKPYCDEHAKLAYVRVRDRKDDAA
jgi:GcrA cell cycle regulator